MNWEGERALCSGGLAWSSGEAALGKTRSRPACRHVRLAPGAPEARLFWRGASRSGWMVGRTSAASLAGWTCGPVCFMGATAEAEKPPFPIRVGNTQSPVSKQWFLFYRIVQGWGVCFQGDHL